ncbi:MAG: flagellar hook assembly protein FlgD [Rhizobiales bacterium]|nr:flagellar hook assembly protein FlgD [Hyphomicrobiales bacterium]
MSTISGVNPAASSAASSAASATSSGLSKSRQGIANNFDQFLSLLTTQLKNQSPLDPLDSNQFTQQLVQFAGVEQQLRTNETLESLVSANKVGNATAALGFVGAKVTVARQGSPMQDGKVKWLLNAPRAGQAAVTVKDKDGNIVHQRAATLRAGEQEFVWDGKLQNGSQAPDGEYSISMTATDSANQVLEVKSLMLATVDSVDVSGTSPMLRIGSFDVPLTDVKSILRS